MAWGNRRLKQKNHTRPILFFMGRDDFKLVVDYPKPLLGYFSAGARHLFLVHCAHEYRLSLTLPPPPTTSLLMQPCKTIRKLKHDHILLGNAVVLQNPLHLKPTKNYNSFYAVESANIE